MEGLQATKLGSVGIAERLARCAPAVRSAAGRREEMGTNGASRDVARLDLVKPGRMKRRYASGLSALTFTLLAALSAGLPLAAQAQSDAVKELAAPPPIQLPLKPSPEFARFPRYTGTLGKRAIVLRLGPKTDDPSGVHGEYQFTDTGEVILIAGDREGDTLEVEESNDGTHITGNWVGKFGPDGVLQGDRMNVDDSDPQPFDLHPLAAGQPSPAVGARPAAQGPGQAAVSSRPDAQASASATAPSSSSASSAPVAATHAVGGVSNLTIGD